MERRIRIGVSACLLGRNVRYDGGHKHDRYLTDTLGALFEFVPVCPEVECGLPAPREPMRLEGDPAAPRLIAIHTGIDLTDRMLSYCERKTAELAGERLAGFILKARSPSCGVFDTPILTGAETVPGGAGLFARSIGRGFPGLPVEDEETIQNPERMKKFLEQAGHSPAPG